MVKKEPSVYLFIGQDSLSKDVKLKQLKQQFLSPQIAQFNLDTLYAKELDLKGLQEKLLCLPAEAKKRMVVIKDAQALKEDVREFITDYVKRPYSHIILVLDISQKAKGDKFIDRVLRYACVCRFKETMPADAFMLSEQIDRRQIYSALRLLNQLLKNGEKPERILGGLRYAWEREIREPWTRRKRLKALLNCDIEIKTGRFKPAFALEKLVVKLCLPAGREAAFGKVFG